MAIKKLEIDVLALLEALQRALAPADVVMGNVSVGASATLLVADGSGPIHLKNNGASTAYIGSSSGVTTETGYPLAAGAELSFTCGGPLSLYAICAASQSTTIRVLRGA